MKEVSWRRRLVGEAGEESGAEGVVLRWVWGGCGSRVPFGCCPMWVWDESSIPAEVGLCSITEL